MTDQPPIGEGEDVEALHRTVVREPAEPTEGNEPAPWWLWAIAAVALVMGGYTLGRYGGVFDNRPHLAYPPDEVATIPAVEAPRQPELVEAAAAPPDGSALYTKHCATCHQPTGSGVAGAFPPLVGSEWVEGPPEVMVRIVLGGLQGPITVAGVPYNGVMPAFADLLTDAEIAAVITYERDMAGVAPADVPVALVTELRAEAAGRAGPYTAAELGAGP